VVLAGHFPPLFARQRATLISPLLFFFMKSVSRVFTFLLAFLLLASAVTHAQDKPQGWSRKAKGAVGGGVGGAVVGGLIGGKTGAIIGAGAGAVGGGAIGRKQDKKKDPARYYHYRNKK
jgi:osmotically inducible lipoprotein OsmB